MGGDDNEDFGLRFGLATFRRGTLDGLGDGGLSMVTSIKAFGFSVSMPSPGPLIGTCADSLTAVVMMLMECSQINKCPNRCVLFCH